MKYLALFSLLALSGCAFLSSPIGQAVASTGVRLGLSLLVNQADALRLQLNELIERADNPLVATELRIINQHLAHWWRAYIESGNQSDRAALLYQLQAIGETLTIATDPSGHSADAGARDFGNGWIVE